MQSTSATQFLYFLFLGTVFVSSLARAEASIPSAAQLRDKGGILTLSALENGNVAIELQDVYGRTLVGPRTGFSVTEFVDLIGSMAPTINSRACQIVPGALSLGLHDWTIWVCHCVCAHSQWDHSSLCGARPTAENGPNLHSIQLRANSPRPKFKSCSSS